MPLPGGGYGLSLGYGKKNEEKGRGGKGWGKGKRNGGQGKRKGEEGREKREEGREQEQEGREKGEEGRGKLERKGKGGRGKEKTHATKFKKTVLEMLKKNSGGTLTFLGHQNAQLYY